MTKPGTHAATLDLLIQVDRLLAEAEKTRSLRDRLIAAARDATDLAPPIPADRKAVSGAR